jgi:hypothetical protein
MSITTAAAATDMTDMQLEDKAIEQELEPMEAEEIGDEEEDGKAVDGGLEIDKEYVTEEVMIAKRKDGKIAVLNVGNLEWKTFFSLLLYF